MTSQDLRKLTRIELLDLLIDQTAELESVKEKLRQAEEKLQERAILLDEAGSISEAAIRINGVFAATETACKQYLDSVQLLARRQEQICMQRDRASRAQADKMLEETRKKCDDMLYKARTESRKYWDELSVKLDAYYAQHVGLRELLTLNVLPNINQKMEEDA